MLTYALHKTYGHATLKWQLNDLDLEILELNVMVPSVFY